MIPIVGSLVMALLSWLLFWLTTMLGQRPSPSSPTK
jgi:hypothetical protein